MNNPSVKTGKVILIPTVLQEDALHTIPAYITDAVKECTVFFVENEKTTRRFFKSFGKKWSLTIISGILFIKQKQP